MRTRDDGAGQPAIRIQDIRTLFRAQEIVSQLAADGLEPAIRAARELLLARRSRWQYLQEMLPAHVAQAVPDEREPVEVECVDSRRFLLRRGPSPLVRQIAHLEQQHRTQVVRVIHGRDGTEQVYWL